MTATIAPESRRTGVFSRPYRTFTIGILLSLGMVAFESLGVATVLPDVARELNGMGAFGWGLSALMLGNIIGTVVAGQAADHRGPLRPVAAGMLVFTLGCVVAGVAVGWPLFLIGRFVQGLGVGAIAAMAYTVVGLAYPQHLRARMYALLSSAWTIPSLAGPAVAGLLADLMNWRAVFVLLIPIVAIAAVLTLPGLRGLTPAAANPSPDWKRPLLYAIGLTFGTGLLLQALLLESLPSLLAGAVVGIGLALPSLAKTTPAGTLRARPGIGGGIVLRGLLCAVYFGSEAFLPLGLREVRDVSTVEAGLGLSAGAITWVIGSMLQAKLDGRGGSRPARVAIGFAILLAGVAGIGATIVLPVLPAWTAIAGWAVGGLGMGIAFNASTTDTLEQTPATRQGEVSAALQLAQTLATAVIAGLGGAAIAFSERTAAGPVPALTAIFGFTAVLSLIGVVLARRLRA